MRKIHLLTTSFLGTMLVASAAVFYDSTQPGNPDYPVVKCWWAIRIPNMSCYISTVRLETDLIDLLSLKVQTDLSGPYRGEYKGVLRNRKPDGVGEFRWSSGMRYIGEWQDGKQHGRGSEEWFDGSAGENYFGNWQNGKYHGEGTYKRTLDGKLQFEYQGTFANGFSNGFGNLKFDDVPVLVGEFTSNFQLVSGTMLHRHGVKDVGNFANACIVKGTRYSPSGQIQYVGEFKNCQPHGQGTFFGESGQKWVGEFKDGYMDGIISWTQSNGRTVTGRWAKGKFVGP